MLGVLSFSLAASAFAQTSTYGAAQNGTALAAWVQKKGLMPLVVIGGVIVLALIFVLLAKNRRDS